LHGRSEGSSCDEVRTLVLLVLHLRVGSGETEQHDSMSLVSGRSGYNGDHSFVHYIRTALRENAELAQ
jgi:hypothetical protein